jgi:DNA polymerase (family X)
MAGFLMSVVNSGVESLFQTILESEIDTLSEVCSKVEIAGSIRRHKVNPHDIDLVIIPKDSFQLKRIQEYAKFYEIGNIGIGDAHISYNKQGIEINLFIATEENLGAMLLTRTGSAGYNIGLRIRAKKLGYKLNEYGLWKGDACIASKTEEDIYKALGKQWKEPILRE